MQGGVCSALGSVSPEQPQSELRRFATLLGDSVPSCTPAKGTLSLLTPAMTASPFFIFLFFLFFIIDLKHKIPVDKPLS